MRIKLGDHFSYRRILVFVIPSVLMVVFSSVYGIVDGLFITNFVGKSAFAAINLFIPVLMIFGAIGFMLGSGGCALVSKLLGEGKREKANSIFSFLVYATVIIGVVVSAVAVPIMPQIAKWIKADGDMYGYCVLYGRILFAAMPLLMLQNIFQSFFIVAEKPFMGFICTVAAGVTNMVFDAIFIAGFKWKIAGAAVATVISYGVGSLFPIIYFARRNDSLLRLGKTEFDGKAFIKTITNGSSEFVSNISGSVVGMVYNFKLLQLAGQNGVAAYGVLMYVSMIFIGILYGYSIGISPIISYHYGANNQDELKSLFRKSMLIMGIAGIAMTALSICLSTPLAKLFVGYDAEVCEMTVKALFLYSFAFIFSGFGVFASAFFTALNNGLISAVISFSRTLVFQIITILILPIFFKLTGAGLSMLVAEILSTILAIIFCIAYKKRYGY